MDIVAMVPEEDKRILAEGLVGEKTDTTYNKVMRLLQTGFGGSWVDYDNRMETQRVQIIWKAKRNRGFCEVKGCTHSIWAHSVMHWHHNIDTRIGFKRWISWYRDSLYTDNEGVYEEEMKICTLLCERHHRMIHKIDAALKYDQEMKEKMHAEAQFKAELTDQGVTDEYYIAKALREHRRLN